MSTFIYTFVLRAATASVLIAGFLFVFFFLPPFALSLLFALCALYVLIVEWKNLFSPESWLFWLLMPIYPVLPFILLVLLNQNTDTRFLLLVMLALVNAFDTGAYLVGSLIGTHKLAPRVSPGKTWEGLAGGLIACFFMMQTVVWYLDISPCLFNMLCIVGVTSLLALFGDLFESLLKRRAGIKDSGSLLPGHGGVLDRFDSILFVIFFFYLWREYLLQVLG